MTSAALPPLPSIRAKDLEMASATLPPNKSTDAKELGDTPENEQSGPENGPSGSTSRDLPNLPPNVKSSTLSQSHTQRSEELAMLHQKEEKVFGGLPPLEAGVICDAVHQYIATTSAFLNSYIADANACHEGIDHKLTVLEKQMSLLESKFASVPGLFPEKEESGHDDHSEENDTEIADGEKESDHDDRPEENDTEIVDGHKSET